MAGGSKLCQAQAPHQCREATIVLFLLTAEALEIKLG